MSTSSKQLHCPVCAVRNPFVGEEALRSHLAQVHYKCRPYPCVLCAGAERFPTETGVRHHVETQHGVKKYKVSLIFFLSIDFIHHHSISIPDPLRP